MILKIVNSDGSIAHYVEFSGALRVDYMDDVSARNGSAGMDKEPTAECLEFITPIDPGMPRSGVTLRPEGVPLRTYITNWDAYLMSDKGKTVEVLHRCT